MAHPSHVALDKLERDPENIRKGDHQFDQVMAGTIAARGIIEPLICRPDPKMPGNYLVTDGGRRLVHLQHFAKEGVGAQGIAVTAAYPVPIIVRDDTPAQARETSLMVAIATLPAHPVDQYEAFHSLAHPPKGQPAIGAAEIAVRFGIAERVVAQQLALGALSPTIRQAWRDGKMAAETARAFTISSDHKQQDRVYRDMEKSGAIRWGGAGGQVQRALAGKGELAGGRLIFVGEAEYEKAGGKIMRDLFVPTNSIVSDPALLQRLVDEKIASICGRLVLEGWSWAKPDGEIKEKYRYGVINKKKTEPTADESTRITVLEKAVKAQDDGEEDIEEDGTPDPREELEALLSAIEGRSFTDKDKARSGCGVGLTNAGTVSITYGLIPPEAQSSRAGSSSRSSADRGTDKPKTKPNTISNSLKADMEVWARKATKITLVTDTYKDPRAPILAKILAGFIEAERHWQSVSIADKDMAAIRDAATPSIVKAAYAKAFDSERFFKGITQAMRMAALKEMGHDGAKPGKAAETIGLCRKFAAATAWLPKELRWAHYDGPGSGKPAKRKTRR